MVILRTWKRTELAYPLLSLTHWRYSNKRQNVQSGESQGRKGVGSPLRVWLAAGWHFTPKLCRTGPTSGSSRLSDTGHAWLPAVSPQGALLAPPNPVPHRVSTACPLSVEKAPFLGQQPAARSLADMP